MVKLAQSATKEGIEKLINQYFYSTSYQVKEDLTIIGKKGILENFKVEFKKNKYIFFEL